MDDEYTCGMCFHYVEHQPVHTAMDGTVVFCSDRCREEWEEIERLELLPFQAMPDPEVEAA